jgi:acyl carrier protein
MTSASSITTGPATPEFLQEMATMIVATLNLEVTPEQIEPDEPLYGDGLGLDSIDILEVALVISKTYGLQLKTDSDDNVLIFRSLRSLAEHVAAFRTQ